MAVEEIDRNLEQLVAADQANLILNLQPKLVAAELPADKQLEGFQLADKIERAKNYIQHVDIYRNQINYGYWKIRCEAEQEPAAIVARTNMFDANELLDKGDLDQALKKYDVAWQAWDELYNKFPSMMLDDSADEVVAAIDSYRKLLDEPELPKDFPLGNFLRFREVNKENLLDPTLLSMVSEWPARYPNRNFLTEMLRKSSAHADQHKQTEATTEPPATPAEVTPKPDQPSTPVGVPADAAGASGEAKAVEIEVQTPDQGSAPSPIITNVVPSEPAKATGDTTSQKMPVDSTQVVAPDDGAPPSPK